MEVEEQNIYNLEELRYKTALEQKKAYTLLLEIKTKELELEKTRLKRENELSSIHQYLLDVEFGNYFSFVSFLDCASNLEDHILNLYKLNKYALPGAEVVSDVQLCLRENKSCINYDNLKLLASRFFNNYKRFIALGHPGYSLRGELWNIRTLNGLLKKDMKLYHLGISIDQIFWWFQDRVQKGEAILQKLYQEAELKRAKEIIQNHEMTKNSIK
ncbi:hypothetical protein K4L44_11975 [Halosquirtibacter laminarini]|uniref:Uncharacterized protein n=1 Tax=Halosquirtibacter laminarini TaxID=3374600 RepID=A0AC61NCN6_9BACT|nr:hypothetical protein K4L44_11975 [Prolixibacteraceae bacterium]